MTLMKRLKESAKTVPLSIWVAGLVIPGGFTAIGLYMAYKAAKLKNPEQTLGEFVEQVMREERENNDKG